MATSYYTDSMREFVAELDNKYNFPVEISILEDAHGEFLVLAFTEFDYEIHRLDDHFREVGEYLVELRKGLCELGARVTFAVKGGPDEQE
jgi:hypothetical protein